MVPVVDLVDDYEIPGDVYTLPAFRKWTSSAQFPEKGRIDFLQGRIEVDMSPEDLFTHGTLKTEFARVLSWHVRQHDLGELFIECTRVVAPEAMLSTEPDMVFLTHQSIESGKVLLVEKRGHRDRFVEVEGAPDLVIEIVSDSSVTKDTKRLLRAYFEAGIDEYWLADARGTKLLFRIFRRGKAGYTAVKADAEGYQRSAVFDHKFRLRRTKRTFGRWKYDLQMKP